MINWQPDFLENEIVKIVPLTENDFELLFKVAADPLIWEQHPTQDRYKKEVFKLFFDSAVASQTDFLIKDKISNLVIGSTRYYDFKPADSSIAIGYTFLALQYWGGRYNKAVKELLLDYAFRFVHNVYFHIGAGNTRSQLAIIRVGAHKVKETDFDHYGEKVLHYEYLLSRHEWAIIKAGNV